MEADDECAAELEEGLRAGGLKNQIIHRSTHTEAQQYLIGENRDIADPETAKLAVILIGFSEDPNADYEFIQWLRAKPEFYNFVVIALGRASRHAEVSRAYECGANAYFIKGAGLDPMLRTLKGIAELQSDTSFFAKPAEKSDSKNSASQVDFIGILTDDMEGAKIIELILRELGFTNPFLRIRTVPEAQDLLAKADHTGAMVVLFADLHLDGSQSFLAWLGSNPNLRPPAVVAVTGGHDMRLVMQAYNLGVNSFIKQPPRRDEMRNTLESLRGIHFSEDGQGRRIVRA